MSQYFLDLPACVGTEISRTGADIKIRSVDFNPQKMIKKLTVCR